MQDIKEKIIDAISNLKKGIFKTREVDNKQKYLYISSYI